MFLLVSMSLTDNEGMRRIKKEGRRPIAQQQFPTQRYKIIEKWECNWCELNRTDVTIKNHLRAKFPYERPLSDERLMQEIKSGKLFSYVHCDLKVPEHLKAYIANFPFNFQKHCCK